MPVPKNEFVDLMRRGKRPAAGRSGGALPRRGGAAGPDAERPPAQRTRHARLLPAGAESRTRSTTPNLRLIFYDDPITGDYAPWLDGIMKDRRYIDMAVNRAWFAEEYRKARGRAEAAGRSDAGTDRSGTDRFPGFLPALCRLYRTAMTPFAITDYTLVSALGAGRAASLSALKTGVTGLTPCAFESVDIPTWVGEVADVDAVRLPERACELRLPATTAWREMALQADGFLATALAALEKYGAHRVGVFLGTAAPRASSIPSLRIGSVILLPATCRQTFRYARNPQHLLRGIVCPRPGWG